MERTKENVVSCYFTYMQDGWCEEECRTIFGARAEAVWIMWCKNLSAGASGSGLFYLALDKDDKIRLVDRAVRFVEKRIDDESQLLVCDECGSREIQMMAWVDPNTSECTSTIDADSDDRWCDTCQEHVWFCSLAEFRQRLDAWWKSTDHSKKEEITGLCRTDFPAGDDCRAFVEACNAWWREHDYEGRRALWMEYDDSRVAADEREGEELDCE